jgi:hypothetical protein
LPILTAAAPGTADSVQDRHHGPELDVRAVEHERRPAMRPVFPGVGGCIHRLGPGPNLSLGTGSRDYWMVADNGGAFVIGARFRAPFPAWASNSWAWSLR